MVGLNLDIIHLILDFIYWEDNGIIDRNTLATASRISRSWRLPAQTRLFHTVTIESRGRLLAFGKSAPRNSARGRQLRAMVIDLVFYLSGHSAILGLSPYRSLLERDMLSLLPTLGSLYQLRVCSYASQISVATQRNLSSPKMPPIRALEVIYLDDPPDRDHRIFFHLLFSIPTVERAWFVGKGTYQWPTSTTSVETRSVALKELRVNLLHSQPSVKGCQLEWLLKHSKETLEVLCLYDLILDESMSDFILSFAPRLVSFHVSSSGHSDLVHLPTWVKAMTQLKELVIRNDLPSADCFRVTTDLVRLIAALPPTLEHLGFAVDDHAALELAFTCISEWRRQLQSPLPTLTIVLTSIKPLTQRNAVPGVDRLRLYYHKDPDVIFAMMSPMLPSNHFPRLTDASLRGRMIAARNEGEDIRRDNGLWSTVRRALLGAS